MNNRFYTREIGRALAFLVAIVPPVISARSKSIEPTVPTTTVRLSCQASRLAGGELSACTVEVKRDGSGEVTVKLQSSNNKLLQLSETEVTLRPKESGRKFQVRTATTQIKANVQITAYLVEDRQTNDIATVEVVPALLESVGLSTSSILGTGGAQARCTVQLKVPAPPGGIQLYLSPVYIPLDPQFSQIPISFDLPSVVVPAGSKTVEFGVLFDRLIVNGLAGSDFREFNSKTRGLEFLVALEPQIGLPPTRWQPIKEIAIQLSLQVTSLLIKSMNVQPSTITGGTEALASVTMSAPPGFGERIYVTRPRNAVVCVTRVGSSCVPTAGSEPLELQLTPGVSTLSFKICSSRVTTLSTSTITAAFRTGNVEASITVNP